MDIKDKILHEYLNNGYKKISDLKQFNAIEKTYSDITLAEDSRINSIKTVYNFLFSSNFESNFNCLLFLSNSVITNYTNTFDSEIRCKKDHKLSDIRKEDFWVYLGNMLNISYIFSFNADFTEYKNISNKLYSEMKSGLLDENSIVKYTISIRKAISKICVDQMAKIGGVV